MAALRGVPTALLRCDGPDGWLRFGAPEAVLEAATPGDVPEVLKEVARGVESRGLWACGFLSYEAAPAFDAALDVRRDPEFPAAWFGLFAPPTPMGSSLPPASGHPSPWAPTMDRRSYAAALSRIRTHLASGQTYQVNLTYRIRARIEDPWDLFLHLAGGDPPYAAYLDTGAWTICSASPEMLFVQDGDRIQSRPMKGTTPRGRSSEEDLRRAQRLLRSEKERAENVMIVDMVRNDIGRVGIPGSVRVPRLFTVERHASVWQMTSTVVGRTRGAPYDTLGALFPAASVTGAPRRRTMQIIRELETTPRRIYTGAIGWIAPGRRARFSVAIRTAAVRRSDGEAEYGVGGGIVWDSRTDAEWSETLAKARILGPSRPPFDLLETLRWDPTAGYWLREHHLQRLARSAAYFGYPLDRSSAAEELERVVRHRPSVAQRVRLRVSREGAVSAEASGMDALSPVRTVRLAHRPIDPDDVFLYHKTTNRRVYASAMEDAPAEGDALLYNPDGEVTETTIANVAVERGGALITPPIRCGLLPGTCRQWMLDQGRVREGVVTVREVLATGRLWLMNAVRGMWQVTVDRGSS